MKRAAFAVSLLLCSSAAFQARADSPSTEDRFHDLFVTAGYATAFGAALGAACLSFVPDPASQLRFVAVGASLGFIGGSILGTYVVFSPVMLASEPKSSYEPQAMPAALPAGQIMFRPVFNKHGISSIQGAMTLASF